MYTLYTDKQENFEANITLNGAALKDTFCRLVVESDSWGLVFKGNIDENGKCEIPIKKLKNVLSEGTAGNMKLEVVADDTYFVPWSSEFVVERARQVTAEVVSQNKKKRIKESSVSVKIKSEVPKIPIIKEAKSDRKSVLKKFTMSLMRENISFTSLKEHQNKISELMGIHITPTNLSESDQRWVLKSAFEIIRRR